jgi:hypothetical protein
MVLQRHGLLRGQQGEFLRRLKCLQWADPLLEQYTIHAHVLYAATDIPTILASFQTHMLLRSLLNILMYIAQVMAIRYTAAVCAAEGTS